MLKIKLFKLFIYIGHESFQLFQLNIPKVNVQLLKIHETYGNLYLFALKTR